MLKDLCVPTYFVDRVHFSREGNNLFQEVWKPLQQSQ